MNVKDTIKPVRLHFDHYVPDLCDLNLPPIIFLHGAGATHTTWSKVMTKIANKTKREAYAIDLRNHGESVWTDQNTLDGYIADLENFLTQNGITKCLLVAHSLGGKISMFFALTKPDYVEKLVVEEINLSNPPPAEVDKMLELISAMKRILLLPKGLSEKDVRGIISRIAEEKFPDQSGIAFYTPLRKGFDGRFQFNFNLEVLERTIKDGSAYVIDFNKCKKFYGPAMVVFAKASYFKVREDQKIKEYFPSVKLCEFSTDLHVIHVDRPTEYIERVSSFINN